MGIRKEVPPTAGAVRRGENQADLADLVWRPGPGISDPFGIEVSAIRLVEVSAIRLVEVSAIRLFNCDR